jgi:hypothetical protein
VEREEACVLRRFEPWLANWAEVRRERSNAARPTALRDILGWRHGYWIALEEQYLCTDVHGALEFGVK